MPGTVTPVDDECEQLLLYVDEQRNLLKVTAYGLSDDQARMTPTASALSIGGLVKHLSSVERFWMAVVEERVGPDIQADGGDYESGFVMGPDETVPGLFERYAATAAATEAVARAVGDPGHRVTIPRDVPWFPKDVEAWSLRWVLLHLIQETARHAGHADVIRESIDGAAGFSLRAAAEDWPAVPWLEPWRPD
jgi:uncharacterized damage-inducible protein DinB